MRLRGTEMEGGVCPEELRPEGGSRPLANGSPVWCPGHQVQGKQFRRRQVSREHCREGQRPARGHQAQDTVSDIRGAECPPNSAQAGFPKTPDHNTKG